MIRISVAGVFLLWATTAVAQQAGSAPSKTGDPAASSARNGLNAKSGGPASTPSGSGSSPSGGRDANRDAGRDNAPGSGLTNGGGRSSSR